MKCAFKANDPICMRIHCRSIQRMFVFRAYQGARSKLRSRRYNPSIDLPSKGPFTLSDSGSDNVQHVGICRESCLAMDAIAKEHCE